MANLADKFALEDGAFWCWKGGGRRRVTLGVCRECPDDGPCEHRRGPMASGFKQVEQVNGEDDFVDGNGRPVEASGGCKSSVGALSPRQEGGVKTREKEGKDTGRKAAAKSPAVDEITGGDGRQDTVDKTPTASEEAPPVAEAPVVNIEAAGKADELQAEPKRKRESRARGRPGSVDLREFQPHPDNPNKYTDKEFRELLKDVKRRGGPCEVVEYMEDAEGKKTILRGHHNAKACLELGITNVTKEHVRKVKADKLVDQYRVIYRSNQHGRMDVMLLAEMFAHLRDKDGMSVSKISDAMNVNPGTVEEHLQRYDLRQTLSPTYAKQVGTIPQKALRTIRKARTQIQATLVHACAAPVEFFKGSGTHQDSVDEAEERWNQGGLSSPEVEMLFHSLDGDTEQSVADALASLCRFPKRKKGRPKKNKDDKVDSTPSDNVEMFIKNELQGAGKKIANALDRYDNADPPPSGAEFMPQLRKLSDLVNEWLKRADKKGVQRANAPKETRPTTMSPPSTST